MEICEKINGLYSEFYLFYLFYFTGRNDRMVH